MNQIFENRVLGVGDFALLKVTGTNVVFVWYREDEYRNIFLTDSTAIFGHLADTNEDALPEIWRRRFRYAKTLVSVSHRRYTMVRRFKELFCLDVEVLGFDVMVTYPQRAENNGFFSNNYRRTSIYRGLHGYHYHHGERKNEPAQPYSGHRIGVELEVCFNSSSELDNFVDKPSNWLFRERDGSLDNYGCEIITVPLLPNDAKSVDFWKVLTDDLQGHARSWETSCCGLHVHIGREILGRNEEERSETLGKLLYLYHHCVKDMYMNGRIYGRTTGYHECDGKTDVGNAVSLLGKEVLGIKSVQDNIKNSMTRRSSRDRYYDINITNNPTIEFRKGKGSINAKRIAAVVEYNEKLCLYAKNTPWTQISQEDFVAYLRATASDTLKEYMN
jgi:hypothetical protein